MNRLGFFILVFLFLFVNPVFSQNKHVIDSLENALKVQKEDTTKANILIGLCWENSRSNIKVATKYGKQSLSLSEKLNFKPGLAKSTVYMGILQYLQGNYDSAMVYYKKGLPLATEIKNTKLITKCLVNMGLVNAEQGRQEEALKYYFQALDIAEKTKDPKGIAGSIGNIGNIYFQQNNFDKALECFEKAIENYTKINDVRGIANNMVSTAVVYKEKKNYKKALEYDLKVLKIFEEQGDKNGLARTMNNLGVIYSDLHDFASAKKYYQNSLQLQEEINDQRGVCFSLNNLALVYLNEKKYPDALDYFNKSLALSIKIGDLEEQSYNYKDLSNLYVVQKDYENAYKNQLLYKKTADSILTSESANKLNELNTKYETEKKEAENKLLQTQNLLSVKTIRQQKVVSVFIIFGFISMSLFAFFIFRGLKKQRKTNLVISEQKLIVEQQKNLVEEKHKEITDSINYAERIQRALLASKKLLDENLTGYFILFKPKDIVSGDFYWAAKLSNNQFVLVTADSTGHGVPGAIMSILNIACLKEAVSKGITSVDLLLNETRRLVIENLMNDGSAEGGKDGMDGSMLSFDLKNNIVYCASANNPIWIIRGKEFIEIKADRMPIGKHENEKTPFSLHSQNLQKGDIVYTLTDGFADQFGGTSGKKFKHKQLQELLLSISNEPMEIQKQKLNEAFDNWKGNLEQIDDVCLMGVKI